MPRLNSEYEIHRAPTVGLAVVGALLTKHSKVVTADLFPMTIVGEQVWATDIMVNLEWQGEARRMQRFLMSGAHLFAAKR